MSQTLVKIIEEVKALSAAERRQLAHLLENLNHSPSAIPSESKLEAELEIEGWLTLPSPASVEASGALLPEPLHVPGRSCSEILLDERR